MSAGGTFIQWKGTDVCMDVTCPCGESGHVDGYFAYHLSCTAYGRVLKVGTEVSLAEISLDELGTGSVVNIAP